MTDRQQFIAGLVILGLTLVLGLWQWSNFRGNQILRDAYQDDAQNLTVARGQLTDEYFEIRAQLQEDREIAQKSIDSVLPTGEELTSLSRLLDDFAVRNNFSSNPFFISNMSFQNPVQVEDNVLAYTPVSFSFESSRSNLSKFMEFVEQSGSLGSGVRLMSLDNLSVGYPQEYGGAYTIRMNARAYFLDPSLN